MPVLTTGVRIQYGAWGADNTLAGLAVWVYRKLLRPASDISESNQEVNIQVVK